MIIRIFSPVRTRFFKLTLAGLLASACLPLIHPARADSVDGQMMPMTQVPVKASEIVWLDRPMNGGEEAPVDFKAEQIEYDNVNQTVTASGQVEIIQNGKIVHADRVTYSMATESVKANGNVSIMDTNGDVHFADEIDFKDDLKNGYVKKLRSVMADGSRFTAAEGERRNGTKIIMRDASYTPCEECKLDPSRPPVWQINAGKVVQDNEDHTISYNDATFEVRGVPVAYVPYFSHPDGTEDQKSGFLTPKFMYNSEQGFGVEPRYYWAIDPSKDLTIGTRVFTDQAPLLSGEYRQRFEKGSLEFSGSTTYSSRTDSEAGQNVMIDDEMRGHLFTEGRLDIDDKWRAGFNTQLSSDDQYLRQYDITSDNILENEIYAERLADRDYAVVRALAFQDIRVSSRATDQPNILPEIQTSFLGDPNGVLGGRWGVDMSALGLTRDGNGQDVVRASSNAEWKRRDVLDLGFVNTFTAGVRGDIYSTPNRDETLVGAGGDGDSTASRFFPSAHDVLTYPLVNNLDAAQVIFEPTVALTVAGNVDNDSDIPNEDSQDVQIDSINIFEQDRFPGLDRVEDRSHLTYGARTGIYTPDGSQGEFFLGRSFRFQEADNPFPYGSGLDEKNSDIVGHLIGNYQDKFSLNYRFQLGTSNLQSQLHEVSATTLLGPVSLFGDYLYARELEGTDIYESREQVAGGAGWSFTDEWRVRGDARYDLGLNEGLRSATMGFDYIGQCIIVSTSATKRYTDEDTGDNSTTILLSIGLKNLGEFSTGE